VPQITTYAPGIPCWVDFSSPDIDASVNFYAGLFGWDVPQSENPEQTGGYRIANVGDDSIAGLMPAMQEGQPAAWQTYIAVEDADETAEKVKQAGGQVIAEPMDVMELGRMAVFTDPGGAFIAVWQANQMPGAALVNEPGALSWNELNTRDPDTAKSFYGAVFDWTFTDVDFGEAGSYTTFKPPSRGEDDESAGGLLDMRGRVPDEIPPHWLAYFTVGSLDDALQKAKGSGASVAFGPMELPNGKLAVLVDPQGAGFGIYESTDQ
jgi:predicted enzyme related to lactoylglutathione lyase